LALSCVRQALVSLRRPFVLGAFVLVLAQASSLSW
jgi:hypothetical protein